MPHGLVDRPWTFPTLAFEGLLPSLGRGDRLQVVVHEYQWFHVAGRVDQRQRVSWHAFRFVHAVPLCGFPQVYLMVYLRLPEIAGYSRKTASGLVVFPPTFRAHKSNTCGELGIMAVGDRWNGRRNVA